MNISFKLSGTCYAFDVERNEELDTIKDAIEELFEEELGIKADITISDYKNI